MIVTCDLMGRSANQWWQAAATIGYALKHKIEFSIPESTLNNTVWPPAIKGLDTLVSLNVDAENQYPTQRLNEFNHSYFEIPSPDEFRGKQMIILNGYFQSYKYFEHCIPEVRNFLNFHVETLHNTCSIHLRGGDYLQHLTKHPPVTVDYLEKAVKNMYGMTGCLAYFIYTDDVEYFSPIIKELKERTEYFKVKYFLSLYGEAREDFLSLMGHANNITANSSYSVLAAILNPNKNKVVICPHEDNYFGVDNKHLDVSTLYPPSFIRIKY